MDRELADSNDTLGFMELIPNRFVPSIKVFLRHRAQFAGIYLSRL